jgi:GMP synthase (glutamine-hydrolysing)
VKDLLLILDLDHANSNAIARKLRAEHIDCRIVPGDTAPDALTAMQPNGLVLAARKARMPADRLPWRLPEIGLPILALGDAYGLLFGSVPDDANQSGARPVVKTVRFSDTPLTVGMESSERLLDCAQTMPLPDGWQPIAEADGCAVGYRHNALPVYGMQFSVEQNDPDGIRLLLNFAVGICGCTAWWDEQAFVSGAIEEIRRKAGGGPAVCAMTGGLSSGVSAILAQKALGSAFRCIFIDTGLLREQEAEDVMAYYRSQAGINVTLITARDRFLQALAGVEDPKAKRLAVARVLQSILDEETKGLGACAIIRGTNFGDLWPGDEPRPAIKAGTAVIEPVRELFRDEIRRVGEYLEMPQQICLAPPFPGTGLAMRILGETTAEKLDTLRAAESIFREEVELSSHGKKLLQHFAVLSTPQGAGPVIFLRAVHLGDGDTAYAARLPYDLLEQIVGHIMRALPEVSRVLYDLTPSQGYCGAEWQ